LRPDLPAADAKKIIYRNNTSSDANVGRRTRRHRETG
jgi:hypothetical protein